jgi:hypothetical protein
VSGLLHDGSFALARLGSCRCERGAEGMPGEQRRVEDGPPLPTASR